MTENYKKLKEICKDMKADYKSMLFAYIFDIGFQNAKEFTSKDIESCEDRGVLTRDFQQWLIRLAKEICNAVDSPVTLVQYCMAEDIYETRFEADKLGRWKLEEMVKERMSWEDVVNKKSVDYINYLTHRYDCDAEDLELLGIEIPDEYWND